MFVSRGKWHENDLVGKHLEEFPDMNVIIGSNPDVIIIDDVIKPAPAKWDADDWIKYKKENPSYYDEDGRSYRY